MGSAITQGDGLKLLGGGDTKGQSPLGRVLHLGDAKVLIGPVLQTSCPELVPTSCMNSMTNT